VRGTGVTYNLVSLTKDVQDQDFVTNIKKKIWLMYDLEHVREKDVKNIRILVTKGVQGVDFVSFTGSPP
jgi:hypothetical protein